MSETPLAQLEHPAPGRFARAGLWLAPACAALLLGWNQLGLRELPLDAPQQRAAAVGVLMVVLWLTHALPAGITALAPAALFPLLGVMSAAEVAPAYFQDLVLLFLGAMLLAQGLERSGVHRRWALCIALACGASPRSLVFGFLCATATISLVLNNTATALMMLPIAMAVTRDLECGANTRLSQSLLLAIAYAASVGGMGTPVGTAPNQIFLGEYRGLYPGAPEIGFGSWMLAWMPLIALWIPLAWWRLTHGAFELGPEQPGARQLLERARGGLGPWRAHEWRMGALFLLAVVLWATRADLQLGQVHFNGWGEAWSTWIGVEALRGNYASDASVACALAFAAFWIPCSAAPTAPEFSSGALQPGTAASGRRPDSSAPGTLLDASALERVPWDVLLLIGGGFALARGFEHTGLDRVLGASLGSSLGSWPAWAVTFGLVLLVTLASEIASNTALVQLLMPLLASAAHAAGLHPLALMAPAAIAASAGFMLPVATPPNALVFATRRVPGRSMLRAGLWLDLATALLIALCFEFWVRRVWEIGGTLPDWAR